MIFRILKESGYPEDKAEQAAVSMAYALGSLSDEEYFSMMGGAFGGGDMSAVDEFLYNGFEIDYEQLQSISFYIFEEVTKFMEKNLPGLNLNEEQVQYAINAV